MNDFVSFAHEQICLRMGLGLELESVADTLDWVSELTLLVLKTLNVIEEVSSSTSHRFKPLRAGSEERKAEGKRNSEKDVEREKEREEAGGGEGKRKKKGGREREEEGWVVGERQRG